MLSAVLLQEPSRTARKGKLQPVVRALPSVGAPILSTGAVFYPLPDIAVHVVQTKRVGGKAAHRHSSCQTGIAVSIAQTAQETLIVGLTAI